jgi:hypothetical protein
MTEERTPYHAGDQTKQASQWQGNATVCPGQVLPADLQRLIAFGRKVGATVVPLPEGKHTLRISGPTVVILATLPDGDGESSP